MSSSLLAPDEGSVSTTSSFFLWPTPLVAAMKIATISFSSCVHCFGSGWAMHLLDFLEAGISRVSSDVFHNFLGHNCYSAVTTSFILVFFLGGGRGICQ